MELLPLDRERNSMERDDNEAMWRRGWRDRWEELEEMERRIIMQKGRLEDRLEEVERMRKRMRGWRSGWEQQVGVAGSDGEESDEARKGKREGED